MNEEQLVNINEQQHSQAKLLNHTHHSQASNLNADAVSVAPSQTHSQVHENSTFHKGAWSGQDQTPVIQIQGKKLYESCYDANFKIEREKDRLYDFQLSIQEKHQEQMKQQLLETLEMNRKITLMPQIRVRYMTGKEMQVAQKLLFNSKGFGNARKYLVDKSPSSNVHTKIVSLTENLRNPNLHINQTIDRLLSTKDAYLTSSKKEKEIINILLQQNTLEDINKRFNGKEARRGSTMTREVQSQQTSPRNKSKHMVPTTPSIKFRYHDLQSYLNKISRVEPAQVFPLSQNVSLNNSYNNSPRASFQLNQKRMNETNTSLMFSPEIKPKKRLSSLTKASIMTPPSKDSGHPQLVSSRLGITARHERFLSSFDQQKVFRDQQTIIPHNQSAFQKFYELKKSNKKPIVQAYAQLLPDGIYSNEVMESREGCSVVKSEHDNQYYIFGGRNTTLLNKLEIFDPKTRKFHVINREKQSLITGRFNQTMVSYQNKLIIYGGQSGYNSKIKKCYCMKDMVYFDLIEQKWNTIEQGALQRYGRRNHMCWIMSHFMLIYGGLNDFSHSLDDLIIFDLEQKEWISDLNIEGSKRPPQLSHSNGYPVFYEQRNEIKLASFFKLPEIDWGKTQQYIKEEGFYLFGGQLSDGQATNDLWILKIANNTHLKWISANQQTLGMAPAPRYSHSLTYYKRENALLITGGRNDRQKIFYRDIYLLILDSLAWMRIEVHGEGLIGRADHFTIQDGDYDFFILGGLNDEYQLSNKITQFTFDRERVQLKIKEAALMQAKKVNQHHTHGFKFYQQIEQLHLVDDYSSDIKPSSIMKISEKSKERKKIQFKNVSGLKQDYLS